MTTRSVDNYNSVENYNDVVNILVAENAIYNIPNSTNFIGGEIPIWGGTQWALQGNTSLGIGLGSGLFGQGNNCVALGYNSAQNDQSNNAIAIGNNSSFLYQGTASIAIGRLSGNLTQGLHSVAIGLNSGEIAQGANSVAIGYRSGVHSQGQNSIAIGYNSGLTSQPANSIVINSTGAIVNGITSSSCYISPIRNVITGGSTNNFLCYDDTNKELIQASNISFANPVSFPLETITQTSVNFGTLNTGIFSSLPKSINISVAGTQRMDLTGSRLQMALPIQYSAGAQNTPQIVFQVTQQVDYIGLL